MPLVAGVGLSLVLAPQHPHHACWQPSPTVGLALPWEQEEKWVRTIPPSPWQRPALLFPPPPAIPYSPSGWWAHAWMAQVPLLPTAARGWRAVQGGVTTRTRPHSLFFLLEETRDAGVPGFRGKVLPQVGCVPYRYAQQHYHDHYHKLH